MVASDSSQIAVRARWLFPVSSPPLENGVIEIRNGTIVEVHQRPRPEAIDLGDVGLLPGLVNAHVHLEFSHLRTPLTPALPFASWIRAVIAERRQRTVSTEESIRTGLREAAETGTVLLGEIATHSWDWRPDIGDVYSTLAGPTVVAFRELIAPLSDQIPRQLELAQNWLADPEAHSSPALRGISPHAPYTVPLELLRRLVGTISPATPLAIHLAETRAELEFLAHGRGELRDMMEGVGLYSAANYPPGTTPLDYLQPLESHARVLVIHGNYLSDKEWSWLAERKNFTVVYCPRTHASFGHEPHPWREWRARGVRIALGTDGRCSNPDLDLWQEVRLIASQHPEVPLSELLDLATRSGAEALGLGDRLGTLKPGRWATFAIAENSAQPADPDPYRWLRGVPKLSTWRPPVDLT